MLTGFFPISPHELRMRAYLARCPIPAPAPPVAHLQKITLPGYIGYWHGGYEAG